MAIYMDAELLIRAHSTNIEVCVQYVWMLGF